MDILLSQKIFAALSRPRAKGRDFYDIVFLFSLTKPNYGYLEKKIGVKDSLELKEILLAKAVSLDFKILAKDVEPFLIKSDQIARVKTFPKFIRAKCWHHPAFGAERSCGTMI